MNNGTIIGYLNGFCNREFRGRVQLRETYVTMVRREHHKIKTAAAKTVVYSFLTIADCVTLVVLTILPLMR